MSEAGDLLLGIDVGGTKIAGVAVDARSGELRAERRVPIDGGPLEVQVADIARGLMNGAGDSKPAAIGIAVPGLVDTGSGVMRLAVNVDAASWRSVPWSRRSWERPASSSTMRAPRPCGFSTVGNRATASPI